MKKLDIMKKKIEELPELLNSMRKNLFKFRSSSLAGDDIVKKKAMIKQTKKNIARVKTRLNNS